MDSSSEFNTLSKESGFVRKMKLFYDGIAYLQPEKGNVVQESSEPRHKNSTNNQGGYGNTIKELAYSRTSLMKSEESRNSMTYRRNNDEEVKQRNIAESCPVISYDMSSSKSSSMMNQTNLPAQTKNEEPPGKIFMIDHNYKLNQTAVNQTEDENTIKERTVLAQSLKNARESYTLMNTNIKEKNILGEEMKQLIPAISKRPHEMKKLKRQIGIQKTKLEKGRSEKLCTFDNDKNSKWRKQNTQQILHGESDSIKHSYISSGSRYCSGIEPQSRRCQRNDDFEEENKGKQFATMFESKHVSHKSRNYDTKNNLIPGDLQSRVGNNSSADDVIVNDITNTAPNKYESRLPEESTKTSRVDGISFIGRENERPPEGRLSGIEDFKTNLIKQIDIEVKQMKQDGFIDENENPAFTEDTILSHSSPRRNRDPISIPHPPSSEKMTDYSSMESCRLDEFEEVEIKDDNDYTSTDYETFMIIERQNDFGEIATRKKLPDMDNDTRKTSFERSGSPPNQETNRSDVSRLKRLFEDNRAFTYSNPTASVTELGIPQDEIRLSNNRMNSPRKGSSLTDCKFCRDDSISSYCSIPSTPSDKIINQVLTKIKADLHELKQLYQNFADMKKTIHERTDEEPEKYRRQVLQEIDEQMALIKSDRILNELRNHVTDPDRIEYENGTLFVIPDNTHEISKYEQSDDNQKGVPGQFDREYEYVDNSAHVEKEVNDESTENLARDLEYGLNIVETYSINSRKFTELQVKNELGKEPQQSDIEFHENFDNTYEPIGDFEGESAYESVYYVEPDENIIYQNVIVNTPESYRSTIYSTMSGDLSSFDEDDGEIEMRSCEDSDSFGRRETICDERGIIRIERAVNSESPTGSCSSAESASTSLEKENSVISLTKLEYIIDELKLTERKYVDDLKKISTNFVPYIETRATDYLMLRQESLFDDVEEILYRQKNFLAAIEESGNDINKIVDCFLEHDQLFELYPNYFRNKPKADIVLEKCTAIIQVIEFSQEMQDYFEDMLCFTAYLLTPVQRLGRYILFLENIEKELKKLDMPVDNVQKALDIVKGEMSKGNDFVAIDSIQNSPISKLDYGSFKMQEHFSVKKPRRVETTAFIFSNVIVFTTMEPNNPDVFNYYDSIKMEDLRIATFQNMTIHLTDHTKSKTKNHSSRYTYVLEAKTEKIWITWKEAIEGILWQQLYKVKGERKPKKWIQQKTVIKIPSSPEDYYKIYNWAREIIRNDIDISHPSIVQTHQTPELRRDFRYVLKGSSIFYVNKISDMISA